MGKGKGNKPKRNL